MFKIGDKVETPLGVGIIYGRLFHDYTVKKSSHLLDFKENELKPYKTAHEIITQDWGYKQDPNDKLHYTFDDGDSVINHIKFVDLKSLSRVRTWYEDGYDDTKRISVIHCDEEELLVLAQYIRELKEGVYDE